MSFLVTPAAGATSARVRDTPCCRHVIYVTAAHMESPRVPFLWTNSPLSSTCLSSKHASPWDIGTRRAVVHRGGGGGSGPGNKATELARRGKSDIRTFPSQEFQFSTASPDHHGRTNAIEGIRKELRGLSLNRGTEMHLETGSQNTHLDGGWKAKVRADLSDASEALLQRYFRGRLFVGLALYSLQFCCLLRVLASLDPRVQSGVRGEEGTHRVTFNVKEEMNSPGLGDRLRNMFIRDRVTHTKKPRQTKGRIHEVWPNRLGMG